METSDFSDFMFVYLKLVIQSFCCFFQKRMIIFWQDSKASNYHHFHQNFPNFLDSGMRSLVHATHIHFHYIDWSE